MKKIILVSFCSLNISDLMASDFSPSFAVYGTTADPVCEITQDSSGLSFTVNNIPAGTVVTATFNPSDNTCSATNSATCVLGSMPTYTVRCSTATALTVSVKAESVSASDSTNTHTLTVSDFSTNYVSGTSATSHTVRLGALLSFPNTLLAGQGYSWTATTISNAITIDF